MKKSNWVILAVAAVLSAFLLWLWYYLSFNLIDDPLDLVLSVVWWAVIIAAALGIRAAEKKRQERVRTAFLAPGCIYNREAGLLSLAPGASPVMALQAVLEGLKYGFHAEDFPERSEARFAYIVHTRRFEVGRGEGQGSEDITWEGDVVVVSRPDDDPMPFSSREELLHIVEGAPLPATGAGMPLPGQATAPMGA